MTTIILNKEECEHLLTLLEEERNELMRCEAENTPPWLPECWNRNIALKCKLEGDLT
jgi:hypothetical protein